MSAQRRTATKKGATATATPPASNKVASQEKKAAAQEKKTVSTKSGARPEKDKSPEAWFHPLKRRMESLQRTLRETRAEMAKITWPDQ